MRTSSKFIRPLGVPIESTAFRLLDAGIYALNAPHTFTKPESVATAVGPGGWVLTAGVADAVGAGEVVSDAVGLGLAATGLLSRSPKLAMSARTSTLIGA